MELMEQYDEIARCNKCGFCQVACPVFRATGQETGVARGRVALLRALIEKRMSWSRDLEEPLFNCLLCGACTANCFPAVATADLVLAARSEYVARVSRKRIHRLLFDHLLPYPDRLKLAVRSVALGKKSGLSDVARALGLLRFFGRDVSRAAGIIERFPDRALRDEIRPGVLEGKGESLRIGYFVGCAVDLVSPLAGRASVEALRAIARTVEVLENCCCGLPAVTYGDPAAARRLVRRNLALLDGGRFDLIVTDCSSCSSFLKKWPAMLAESDSERRVAQNVAARVRDIVEVLYQKGSNGDRAAKHDPPVAVTYHDPCHAKRGQKIVREPREILRSLPGIEYRELPESDWCCGGAGAYALSHFDLSRKVLDRKIDNVEKTRADVVVTSCPACMIHLSFGLRTRGLPVKVQHISEMVKETSP